MASQKCGAFVQYLFLLFYAKQPIMNIHYIQGDYTMANWNPSQYLKFKNQRTQPAVDLATRTLKYNPKTVADIGCGPGNSTFVLKQLFPNSDITGIDSSPEMILKAKKEYPDIKFEIGDATALKSKYDLIFSNKRNCQRA